jgi:Uma2 family endonuclease
MLQASRGGSEGLTMAQPNTLAPWAELVPDVGPMTPDDLLARPEDDWRYELVEGRLVRMPPTGGEHGDIAGTLTVALGMWVLPRHLGRVLAAETGFQLGAGTVLAPDVAFVQAAHVPAADRPTRERFWALAPDLVAEVASPGETRPELAAKVRNWLAAGVRLAWVVWPRSRQVDVWQPNAQGAAQLVTTLGPGDALDGLDVLPGFAHPVAELFA